MSVQDIAGTKHAIFYVVNIVPQNVANKVVYKNDSSSTAGGLCSHVSRRVLHVRKAFRKASRNQET